MGNDKYKYKQADGKWLNLARTNKGQISPK